MFKYTRAAVTSYELALKKLVELVTAEKAGVEVSINLKGLKRNRMLTRDNQTIMIVGDYYVLNELWSEEDNNGAPIIPEWQRICWIKILIDSGVLSAPTLAATAPIKKGVVMPNLNSIAVADCVEWLSTNKYSLPWTGGPSGKLVKVTDLYKVSQILISDLIKYHSLRMMTLGYASILAGLKHVRHLLPAKVNLDAYFSLDLVKQFASSPFTFKWYNGIKEIHADAATFVESDTVIKNLVLFQKIAWEPYKGKYITFSSDMALLSHLGMTRIYLNKSMRLDNSATGTLADIDVSYFGQHIFGYCRDNAIDYDHIIYDKLTKIRTAVKGSRNYDTQIANIDSQSSTYLKTLEDQSSLLLGKMPNKIHVYSNLVDQSGILSEGAMLSMIMTVAEMIPHPMKEGTPFAFSLPPVLAIEGIIASMGSTTFTIEYDGARPLLMIKSNLTPYEEKVPYYDSINKITDTSQSTILTALLLKDGFVNKPVSLPLQRHTFEKFTDDALQKDEVKDLVAEASTVIKIGSSQPLRGIVLSDFDKLTLNAIRQCVYKDVVMNVFISGDISPRQIWLYFAKLLAQEIDSLKKSDSPNGTYLEIWHSGLFTKAFLSQFDLELATPLVANTSMKNVVKKVSSLGRLKLMLMTGVDFCDAQQLVCDNTLIERIRSRLWVE